MNITDILAKLKDTAGIFEAYHLTTFLCHRETKNGGIQTITVEIQDGGPNDEPSLRYHCHVRSVDGKTATGNPQPTVERALALVHWGDLDR